MITNDDEEVPELLTKEPERDHDFVSKVTLHLMLIFSTLHWMLNSAIIICDAEVTIF